MQREELQLIAQIGDRIRETRRAHGKSAEEVAAALEVSCGTITNVETGKKSPSLRLLLQIASYLRVNPHSFFATPDPEQGGAADAFLNRFGGLLTDQDWEILSIVARALIEARTHPHR